jgi:hypothetical protein
MTVKTQYIENRDTGYYWEIVMGPTKHRMTMRGHPITYTDAARELKCAQIHVLALIEEAQNPTPKDEEKKKE